MSRADDHLFDPAAAPDEEVLALERALRPLRHRARPFDASRLPAAPGGSAPRRRLAPRIVAAVALVAAALALWAWLGGRDPGSIELAPGHSSRTIVAADTAAEVRLGGIAVVELLPGSELAFEHWREDEALFALRRGALRARVLPPPAVQPRFFVVATPLGRVVDLGCRYELRLREDGSAHVRVTEGAVEFALPAGRAFVPAGASLATGPEGFGIPLFDGARAELRTLVRKLESATRLGLDDDRKEVFDRVATACSTGRDTLVLWHLLQARERSYQDLIQLRLLELAGPPPGVDWPTKSKSVPAIDPAVWLAFLRETAWVGGG